MYATSMLGQCNQHVFSTVGSDTWTTFQFQNCDGGLQVFSLPAGGYTMIRCADIGTTFVNQGDGFVYPLSVEHPNYPSCLQENECPCTGDFNEDGYIDMSDLLDFFTIYNTPCD